MKKKKLTEEEKILKEEIKVKRKKRIKIIDRIFKKYLDKHYRIDACDKGQCFQVYCFNKDKHVEFNLAWEANEFVQFDIEFKGDKAYTRACDAGCCWDELTGSKGAANFWKNFLDWPNWVTRPENKNSTDYYEFFDSEYGFSKVKKKEPIVGCTEVDTPPFESYEDEEYSKL